MSPTLRGILKGCFKKDEKNKSKGCFKKKFIVEKRPYFDDAKKGCFRRKPHHYLSDAEYEALVKSMVEKEDFKSKALESLMLDSSEIEEIDPIHFGQFSYVEQEDVDKPKWDYGDDLRVRTSQWQETWIFFSKNSLLAYQCVLNLDNNSRTETTYEYQYKDITSVKVKDEITEIIDNDGQTFKKNCEFEIVVPGDVLKCAFANDSEQINCVKAMKNMIRDKKNNQ